MASSTGKSSGAEVPPVLPSIPLSPEPGPHEQSIGALAKDVTTHLSSLVRSEVELAKAEVSAEVKKGVQGSIFFVIAAVIALFSLFYLFFTLAELLDIWLPRSAAFAIVFGLMIVVAGIFGFLGYLRVRKLRKPERTIESLKDSAKALSSRGRSDDDAPRELPGQAGQSGRHAASTR